MSRLVVLVGITVAVFALFGGFTIFEKGGASTAEADYNWLFFFGSGVQFRGQLPPQLEAALAKAPDHVRIATEQCIVSQGLGAGAVEGILLDLKAGRPDHRCAVRPVRPPID